MEITRKQFLEILDILGNDIDRTNKVCELFEKWTSSEKSDRKFEQSDKKAPYLFDGTNPCAPVPCVKY